MKRIVLMGLLGCMGNADTFYVVNKAGDVNLTVYDENQSIQEYKLKANQEFFLSKYKKICLNEGFKNIEVGIKEDKSITLKSDYKCHNFYKIESKESKKTSLNTIVLKFKSIKNIIYYEPNKKELITLAGRGTAIKISKEKYLNSDIKLDFSESQDSMKIKIYFNDEKVNKKVFSLNDLNVGDILIVNINNEHEEEFEITK